VGETKSPLYSPFFKVGKGYRAGGRRGSERSKSASVLLYERRTNLELENDFLKRIITSSPFIKGEREGFCR
jgi:hypothetical protein